MSDRPIVVGRAYDCPGRGWRATVTKVERSWAGIEVVRYRVEDLNTGRFSHEGTLTPAEFRARYSVPVQEPKA